jgi:hypothetical protein
MLEKNAEHIKSLCQLYEFKGKYWVFEADEDHPNTTEKLWLVVKYYKEINQNKVIFYTFP